MAAMLPVEETHLWCLWDPSDPRPDAEPACSEGYMAAMLGVDRLTLRTMYQDYLQRHNACCAHEVRLRALADAHPEMAEKVREKIEAVFRPLA